MKMAKIFVLLIGTMFLMPTVGSSQNLKIKPGATRFIAPVKVYTDSPKRVNCKSQTRWNGVSRTQYRTIWLQVCRSDKTSCGGAFSTRNDGYYYDFRPDISMAGKDWLIKVFTQDKKYIGYSNVFSINGMLQPCCDDGWHVPPHCNE